MALFDSDSLRNSLERGMTELTSYKSAVDEAASELVNLIRPSIPGWYSREMRTSFAEEILLNAATRVREEL